jgi:hypothetical protein
MSVTPAEARTRFRDGLATPTSGWCPGFAQTNLIAVPRGWAYDFLLFTQRNPQACPVLDVGDPGNPTTALAQDADVRTDLLGYRVWRDGRLVDEPTDVLGRPARSAPHRGRPAGGPPSGRAPSARASPPEQQRAPPPTGTVAARARVARRSRIAVSSSASEARRPRRRHPALQWRTCSQSRARSSRLWISALLR